MQEACELFPPSPSAPKVEFAATVSQSRDCFGRRDEETIARLLEPQLPQLRRHARALAHDPSQADDLVQTCVLRALASWHLWREGSDLRAWLHTILRNEFVSDIRRTARDRTCSDLDGVALANESPAQDDRLALRDLDRALGELPEAQRSIVLLVGMEGMRYEEVAATLKVPVGTVRSRLWRARRRLRRLVADGAGPGPRAAGVPACSSAR